MGRAKLSIDRMVPRAAKRVASMYCAVDSAGKLDCFKETSLAAFDMARVISRSSGQDSIRLCRSQ